MHCIIDMIDSMVMFLGPVYPQVSNVESVSFDVFKGGLWGEFLKVMFKKSNELMNVDLWLYLKLLCGVLKYIQELNPQEVTVMSK